MEADELFRGFSRLCSGTRKPKSAYEVVVARELDIGSTEDVELTTAAVVELWTEAGVVASDGPTTAEDGEALELEARTSVFERSIGALDAVGAIGEELELAAISELAAAMALDEDARGAELATKTAELEESMCEALELVATSALVATDDVAATAELTDAVDDATALYITGVSSVRRS